MTAQPDTGTLNVSVIYKIIGTLNNEVTDIIACFYHNHWLLETASLWRRSLQVFGLDLCKKDFMGEDLVIRLIAMCAR
jgi:hypothetical protein